MYEVFGEGIENTAFNLNIMLYGFIKSFLHFLFNLYKLSKKNM